MISIVTVCIDSHPEVFKRFISSLKQYTTVPFELIIIDNESENEDNIKTYNETATKYFRFDKRVSVAQA